MKVLTPPALAPTATLITLCSLSTGMKSASISPLLTNSAICSTISVCGVIGNAGTTSTLASVAAQATAWSPLMTLTTIPSPP